MPIPHPFIDGFQNPLQGGLIFFELVLNRDQLRDVLGNNDDPLFSIRADEWLFDGFEVADFPCGGILAVFIDNFRFALGHDAEYIFVEKIGHFFGHAKITIMLADHLIGGRVVKFRHDLVAQQEVAFVILQNKNVGDLVNDVAQKLITAQKCTVRLGVFGHIGIDGSMAPIVHDGALNADHPPIQHGEFIRRIKPQRTDPIELFLRENRRLAFTEGPVVGQVVQQLQHRHSRV